MGVINFVPSKEMSLPSISRYAYFRQIHVTNWRLLASISDSDTLVVITHNYRTFEVEGITFKELLDNNSKKGPIERPFKYHSTTVACVACHGSGKVDWIGKIMKRNADAPNFPLKHYIRDPKHINEFHAMNIIPYLVSFISKNGIWCFFYGAFHQICKKSVKLSSTMIRPG